jgi:hypothetical protein
MSRTVKSNFYPNRFILIGLKLVKCHKRNGQGGTNEQQTRRKG